MIVSTVPKPPNYLPVRFPDKSCVSNCRFSEEHSLEFRQGERRTTVLNLKPKSGQEKRINNRVLVTLFAAYSEQCKTRRISHVGKLLAAIPQPSCKNFHSLIYNVNYSEVSSSRWLRAMFPSLKLSPRAAIFRDITQ